MKIKTSELTPNQIAWVVATIEGDEPYLQRNDDRTLFPMPVFGRKYYARSYATNWSLAGPIIEREWIEVVPWPNETDENMRWRATQHDTRSLTSATGATPLIAAMRCFVASRLGDEVDIPEELL